MNNLQVCKAYWNGDIKAHSGNIFIDGATLYSYGTHFPMAVKLTENVVAWNEDKYSVTTSHHQSEAYPYNKTIIPMDTNLIQSWDHVIRYGQETNGLKTKTINWLLNKVEKCITKLAKARSENMKEYWNEDRKRYTNAIEVLEKLN